MGEIDEALNWLKELRSTGLTSLNVNLPDAASLDATIAALEQQRVPDIKAAAQRMAEYLDGYEGDPQFHFSVPRDGGLTNCTVDGEVNLHELAQAALAAAPEPEKDQAIPEAKTCHMCGAPERAWDIEGD